MICIILVAGHGVVLEREIQVRCAATCRVAFTSGDVGFPGRYFGQLRPSDWNSQSTPSSEWRGGDGNDPRLLVERAQKVNPPSTRVR